MTDVAVSPMCVTMVGGAPLAGVSALAVPPTGEHSLSGVSAVWGNK